MTPELVVLTLTVILGLVQLVLSPIATGRAPGYAKWNTGPRDKPFEKPVLAKRFDRDYANFMETFPYFAALVLLLAVTERSSALSIAGAWVYLAARVVYVPLYALGVPVIRSLAWLASLAGIVMCLIPLFPLDA